nr:MAG TPA: hypothetical protein [Caudoviricetes sp.]
MVPGRDLNSTYNQLILNKLNKKNKAQCYYRCY